MAQGEHKITEQFEAELCRYTGAPYAIAVDNCSNALFLALYYELNVKETGHKAAYPLRRVVQCPSHTYPSVPCEIIHAGGIVEFYNRGSYRNGMYKLYPTNVYDSALEFTHRMYDSNAGNHLCISFTGPYKHLKLGKGGAILTDDPVFYKWAKLARFSGRDECSYFEDDFDSTKHLYNDSGDKIASFYGGVVGWNFYMMPEIAARGLQLMKQFYNPDGTPKYNQPLILEYPDLSKFKLYRQ